MRKVAIVFILAVIAPSLALAWLAVRSLRGQEIVLEHQQTLLYQSVADNLALQIVDQVSAVRRDFIGQVLRFSKSTSLRTLSPTFDARRFELKRGRQVEKLTAKELKLLQLFHTHPGEVFSRERLLNEVWGYHYYGTTRTLDQVIVQLRKKLGDSGDSPRHLLTVHGVGYKLVD